MNTQPSNDTVSSKPASGVGRIARLAPAWAHPSVIISGVLLAGLCVASLCLGDMNLGVERTLDGILGRDELAAAVIWNIRLPRLLVAMLAGAALASSGLVMQAYFRNSLASPGLLGVSAGGTAGAVAVLGLVAYWQNNFSAGAVPSAISILGVETHLHSLLLLPGASIVGAFVATGCVLALARRSAGTEHLLLAGVALNALLGAVSSYVLSNVALTYERNGQILFWMLGGLEDRTWEHVMVAAPIVPAALLLWPLGRRMDLLCLGSNEAQSLGVDVRRVRRSLLVISTVLTALATAVTGSIGFVGLIVPHVFRLLVGPEHRRLVPLSLVGGAMFVVACDFVGREFAGGLRIGIVTALVGGPFFLWLLRRQSW